MLLVVFVLLVVFLRSLVAPLYLLAAGVLAVAATLGLTVYVVDLVLGRSRRLARRLPREPGGRPRRLAGSPLLHQSFTGGYPTQPQQAGTLAA